MYINMATSNLLISTHCTYIEMFLKKVNILEMCANVTFNEYKDILQYDSKDALEDIRINQN